MTSASPAAFVALESAARAALATASGADEWDAATRRGVLALLDRVANATTVARGRVITAEKDAGTWALRGDRDLAGFLGRESHQGRSAGSAAVGQAATLATMPAVADALVDGPVTPRHVDELTRATAVSPRLAEQLASREGQERVVELARRFDGQEFGRQLRVMGAAVDPVARQREHEAQRRERFFNLSQGPHGTRIKGYLDTISGYRLGKAIEALDPRPAEDDDRSSAQRRADALVAMAESVLRDPGTTPGSVAPAQVVVTFREETWTALRRGGGRLAEKDVEGRSPATRSDAHGGGSLGVGSTSVRPGDGSTIAVVDALVGRAPVVDEDGNAWPAGEIARVLCECELTRAVLGSGNEVLELGRGVRRFDRRFFAALIAAGWRTCAWPGCGMPLRWSELHHLRWWQRDGGRTELANCGPYCRAHHLYIHDHDVRITRRPDGSYEHRRPDGTPIGITHPGAGGGEDAGEGPPGGALVGDASVRPSSPPDDSARLEQAALWPD